MLIFRYLFFDKTEDMKIEIKDLGAIKSATIDLSKPLNVFAGPNGTGKTYLAYVLYSLFKNRIYVSGSKSALSKEMFKELIEEKETSYQLDFDEINAYRDKIAEDLKADLDSIFGISEEMGRKFFEGTTIQFLESKEELRKRLLKSAFNFQVDINGNIVKVSKEKGAGSLSLKVEDQSISTDYLNRLEVFLLPVLIAQLATFPVSSVYILPVERNSIFTFSKELSIRKQEAIDHFHAMTGKEKIDRFDLLFKTTKRYPSAVRDGLLIAEDLAEIKKVRSPFFGFALELEKALLYGKVEVSEDGELQFKSDKNPKKLLPIQMTASIVKSLASLVIYLKYLAKEHDLIIIDEPEINLHPNNQLVLTRIFARLMAKGFRLIISTHSDYIVRELNNLIMLSAREAGIEGVRAQYGYSLEETIAVQDVAVSYFNYPVSKRNYRQLSVRRLEVTKTGFEIPSIDETIESQNMISEDLYDALSQDSDE